MRGWGSRSRLKGGNSEKGRGDPSRLTRGEKTSINDTSLSIKHSGSKREANGNGKGGKAREKGGVR